MGNQALLKKIETKIDNLPLDYTAVLEVVSLLDTSDSNYDQITEKLSPEVATKFLQMANSVYYARDVRTINYAVRVLGYAAMKQILTTSFIVNHFSEQSRIEGFNFEKFHKQAQFCASVSGVSGQILGYEKPGDLFTVAMLSNIGKLVITVYFAEEHRSIRGLKESEGISSSDAEKRVLGLSHAEIGALVLARFKVSEDICEAIKSHEDPDTGLPKGSNFELDLIARESAKIVDCFVLPEKVEPAEITSRLQRAKEAGREICRKKLRSGIRTKGYRELFVTLLSKASDLVYRDLKKFFQPRVVTEVSDG